MSSPYSSVDEADNVVFPRRYNAAVDLARSPRGAGARRSRRLPRRRSDDDVRRAAERANRVGNALLALGARPEQRVLMVMHDTADFAAVFLGAMKAGLVPVPVNTLLDAGRLHVSRPGHARAHRRRQRRAAAEARSGARRACPALAHVVVVTSPLGGAHDGHRTLDAAPGRLGADARRRGDDPRRRRVLALLVGLDGRAEGGDAPALASRCRPPCSTHAACSACARTTSSSPRRSSSSRTASATR